MISTFEMWQNENYAYGDDNVGVENLEGSPKVKHVRTYSQHWQRYLQLRDWCLRQTPGLWFGRVWKGVHGETGGDANEVVFHYERRETQAICKRVLSYPAVRIVDKGSVVDREWFQPKGLI